MDKYLRMNITFHMIKFSLGNKYFGNVTLTDNQDHVGTFYGKQTNILFVAKFNVVYVNISVHSQVSYYIRFDYSVVDNNLFYNFFSLKEEKKYVMHSTWAFYQPQNYQIHLFVLSTNKYRRVEVKFEKRFCLRNPYLKIFDGPGSLSKIIRSKKRSFTCVFPLTGFHSLIHKKTTDNFYYSYRIMKCPHMKILRNTSFLFDSTEECLKDSKICCIDFETSANLHINATIQKLNYTGVENDAQCSFSGLTANSIFHDKSYEEISTVCEHFKGFYKYRPLYSKESSMRLILYSYKEYGQLSAKILVSATGCKPVERNPCRRTLHCKIMFLAEDECWIVQTVYWQHYQPRFGYKARNSVKCAKNFLHWSIPFPGRTVMYDVLGLLGGKQI